jgi:hypothetical protein
VAFFRLVRALFPIHFLIGRLLKKPFSLGGWGFGVCVNIRLFVRAWLHRLRENARNCHSESRSPFERGEESAFSLVFSEKQIPRFARDDNVLSFFRKLFSHAGAVEFPSRLQPLRVALF